MLIVGRCNHAWSAFRLSIDKFTDQRSLSHIVPGLFENGIGTNRTRDSHDHIALEDITILKPHIS
jgi:hypothetical protein